MEKHSYVIEPTGADSPSQNIGAEKWNDTLAVTARALLYGSALPAKYWSAAITHAAYLHNRWVHHGLMCTPFEQWYGRKPDLRNLRVFWSRVCVKKTGFRRAKLDRHYFTGIFIGYTATDANIRYIDMQSGVVKTCHHAVFDECWFHQPWRPPAAQLLYDLGGAVLDAANDPHTGLTPSDGDLPPCDHTDEVAPSYPIIDPTTGQQTPSAPTGPSPIPITQADEDDDTPSPTDPSSHTNPDVSVVEHYDISRRDVEQIYLSPHHYGHAYEETFGFMGSSTVVHPTADLELREKDGLVFIHDISSGKPCAKIPCWKTRLRNACLLRINDTPITSISTARDILSNIPHSIRGTCRLLVSASEIRDGLTNKGIPQISLDQLNPRHFFNIPSNGTFSNNMLATMVHRSWDGGVLQYITRAHKLTQGILIKQSDWNEWQQSEFIQLDQYELQGMFGSPVLVSNGSAVFNLVWMYAVKEVDGRKKARCTCDGSTRGGQVRVLDYTYASSPDHTCSRIFYALAAAENLVLYGADVSNAFCRSPTSKTGVLHPA